MTKTLPAHPRPQKTRGEGTPREGAPERNTLGDDAANPLGTFLRARRRLVSPEEAGLQAGGHRRVPGLRREEVATLAGVSVAYYIRLEQGRDRHPSDDVLQALARVLRLNGEAARHMQALARPPIHSPVPARTKVDRPQLAALIERQQTPAYIIDGALDVIHANDLARALHPSFRPGSNIILDAFEDREAQSHYAQLRRVQQEVVAFLRTTSAFDPTDSRIFEVIGELTRCSAHFRHLWDRHDIEIKSSSTKSFVRPEFGELTLHYEAFWLADVRNAQMVVYSDAAEPPNTAKSGASRTRAGLSR